MDEIEDEDLLIEAARYAVGIGIGRNRFMSLAKKAWFQAACNLPEDNALRQEAARAEGVKLRPAGGR